MKIEVFGNAFDAIEDWAEVAADLTVKAALFTELDKPIKDKGHTRRELEKLWDIPQPMVSDIMPACRAASGPAIFLFESLS